MIHLSIPFEEAQALIEQIPHERCRKAVSRNWKKGGKAGVTAQSICWLFCWGKTGMTSLVAAREAERVFSTIFDRSFNWFDRNVDHEWARVARYTHGDIEPELLHRLQE